MRTKGMTHARAPVSPWTTAVRCCMLSGLLLALCTPVADVALEAVWDATRDHWLFALPLFEAILSSAAFGVWIALFSFVHRAAPSVRKIDGSSPSQWNRDALTVAVANLVVYNGGIYMWHLVITPVPKPLHAPSVLLFLCELVFGLFLYDLLFFPLHLSFHYSSNSWWRSFHWAHHGIQTTYTERVANDTPRMSGELSDDSTASSSAGTCRVKGVKGVKEAKGECKSDKGGQSDGRRGSRPLRAPDTLRQHVVDGALQVLVNIFVQQISPMYGWRRKHPMSRWAHNVLVTYLLSEAHSGYDLPFMSHRLVPQLFGGSVRHSMHHATGQMYFQQFFMYLDDMGAALKLLPAHPSPKASAAVHIGGDERQQAGARATSGM